MLKLLFSIKYLYISFILVQFSYDNRLINSTNIHLGMPIPPWKCYSIFLSGFFAGPSTTSPFTENREP